jgi:hypothetical protein
MQPLRGANKEPIMSLWTPFIAKSRQLGAYLLRIDETLALFRSCQPSDLPRSGFAGRVLDRLSITYEVHFTDCPDKFFAGPTLVLATHPTGILDGLLISDLLDKVGVTYLVLANNLLATVPELSHRIVGVDVYGHHTRENAIALKSFITHIHAGGTDVVFPTGNVAKFQWSQLAVSEDEWHDLAAFLACKVKAAVFCLHIAQKNSRVFHLSGIISSRIRTVMHLRELLNKMRTTSHITISPQLCLPRPTNRAAYKATSALLRSCALCLD